MSDINEVIRSSAMFASFHATAWSARKQDKSAAKAAAESKGAQNGAYSTYANLMYGADRRLKDVRLVQQQTRELHTKLTLPWGFEGGARLLPVESFFDYTKAIGKQKSEFRQKLAEFLEHYDEDVEAAAANLNLDPGFYPTKARVERAFTMRPEFGPIPEGSQFRGLPESAKQALAEDFERQVQTKMRHGYVAMVNDAAETLKNTAERLRSAKKVHGSAFDQVEALPRTLRRFNITGDEAITALADAIEALRCPEDRRKDIKSTPSRRDAFARLCEEQAEIAAAYAAE